jgi:hypothetical protein
MPPGKRKKRSVVHSSSVALLALLHLANNLDQETNTHCQLSKLCKVVGKRSYEEMGTFDKVLWR